jgi:hypothetical protein
MAMAVQRPRPLSAATHLTDNTNRSSQVIEADPDTQSLSSADDELETKSLTPSVEAVLHQYGRTYQNYKAGGRYMLGSREFLIMLTVV